MALVAAEINGRMRHVPSVATEPHGNLLRPQERALEIMSSPTINGTKQICLAMAEPQTNVRCRLKADKRGCGRNVHSVPKADFRNSFDPLGRRAAAWTEGCT